MRKVSARGTLEIRFLPFSPIPHAPCSLKASAEEREPLMLGDLHQNKQSRDYCTKDTISLSKIIWLSHCGYRTKRYSLVFQEPFISKNVEAEKRPKLKNTLRTYLRIRLTLKLAGGWLVEPPPVGFFSLKFLPLDQLPNAFAQLFLDNEDIFWH